MTTDQNTSPHFSEVHAIEVAAPINLVWQQFSQIDIFSSKLVRLLFKLRRLNLSSSTKSVDFGLWHPTWSKINTMFFPKIIDPPSLLLLHFRPKYFGRFSNIRITWEFRFIQKAPSSTIVVTQTQVFIPYHRLRKLFQIYWFFIRLPSGAIRLEILKLIKQSTEQNN